MPKPGPIIFGTVKREDFKPVERSLKVQENFLRRQANRLGLTLTKSPRKNGALKITAVICSSLPKIQYLPGKDTI